MHNAYMRIISRRRLIDFWEVHPDAEQALRAWYGRVDTARWETIADIKSDFPSADYVGNGRFVFNIRGNNYRLVTVIDLTRHGVLIRWVGTHKDYDKIDVKEV